MKNYKQFIKELPSKKVVFSFGDFQPPTASHELLINFVKTVSIKQNADHIIFVSSVQDAKSNPLSIDRKLYYLRRIFPQAVFAEGNDGTLLRVEVLKKLSKKYKNLIMIVGSDQVTFFKKLLDDHNGKEYKFDSIEVISYGEKDPDSDSTLSITSDKMREAAKKADFSLFKKGLPKSLTDHDSKRLMNEIRTAFGLEPIKESINFERHELREKYHAGVIFKVGDTVFSENCKYEIVKRGSNHLLVKDENGILSNKWLHEVIEIEDQRLLENLKGAIIEMNYSAMDKIKIARLIASSLGVEDVEKSSNAEQLINSALRKIKTKSLRPEYIEVVQKMLSTAQEVGIKYDEKLVPQKAKEAKEITDSENELQNSDKSKPGHSLEKENDHLRKMKVNYHLGESEEKDDVNIDMSDKDIDDLIDSLEDDDFLDAYDDDELAIIDQETGEHVEDLHEEIISEVLSRVERMKAKVRFARTKSKRERKLQIALRTRSSVPTVNKRARRMAINAFKMRLARKPLNKLSTAEKERIERIIQARKNIINRIAMRMVPKIRKIESERLSHRSYTK